MTPVDWVNITTLTTVLLAAIPVAAHINNDKETP